MPNASGELGIYQGRYKVVLVEDAGYYWTLSRYIHLDTCSGVKPLVEDPESWPHSSFGGYARKSKRVDWVQYDQLHAYWKASVGGKVPDRAYRHYVKQGLEAPADSFKHELRQWVFGSEDFLRRMLLLAEGADEKKHRATSRRLKSVSAGDGRPIDRVPIKPLHQMRTKGNGGLVISSGQTSSGPISSMDDRRRTISATPTATNNRYTYAGREWDSELRLYYYRARMCDADAGRFCSRDPIGHGVSRKLRETRLMSMAEMVDWGTVVAQRFNYGLVEELRLRFLARKKNIEDLGANFYEYVESQPVNRTGVISTSKGVQPATRPRVSGGHVVLAPHVVLAIAGSDNL